MDDKDNDTFGAELASSSEIEQYNTLFSFTLFSCLK